MEKSERRGTRKREIMTVDEVAKYLGVHEVTIYRMIKEGKIPAYRIGSQWRFKKTQIETWLEDQANAYILNQQKEEEKNRG